MCAKHSMQAYHRSKGGVYSTWRSMIGRCMGPYHKSFADYGGRGITVCDRWLEFKNFLEDMGERPVGKTIGRINNDEGYYPGNCRWETPKEQSTNKRMMKNNTTGVSGVFFQEGKYMVRVQVDGKRKSFGVYDTLEQATKIRQSI